MSIVATYVQFDDGLFYDTTIYGDYWFICFHDKEPPELVIFGEKDPNELLTKIGIVFEDVKFNRGRMIPPEWKRLGKAKSYSFTLKDVIKKEGPYKLTNTFGRRLDELGQSCFYLFKVY